MKNFSTATKRSLSLLIAAILICASMAVPAWATGYSFTAPPSIYNVTDTAISASLPNAVNGINFKFCAVPASVTNLTIEQLQASDVCWFGETMNALSSAIITKDYSGAVIGAEKEYKVYPMADSTLTDAKSYTIDVFTEVKTLKTAPRAPLGTEIRFISNTYDSITFEVQPVAIEYSVGLGTWIAKDPFSVSLTINVDEANQPLTHSTQYDFYFRFVADENQAVGTIENGRILKITASTQEKEPHATPAAPTVSDNSVKSDTYFSVVYLPGHTYYVNGKEMKLQGTSVTQAGKDFVVQDVFDHQEITFINLTPGTTYTVTCTKNADENNRESAMSPACAAIRTKRVSAVPATPAIKSLTDTKIVFTYVSGVEYALVPTATPTAPADIKTWVRATERANGTHDEAFVDSLTPGTSYSVYARVFETSETVASDATTPITVITLQSAKAAPAISRINVIDKSTNKIILEEFEGIEFRIAKTGTPIDDASWQTSGVFSGLTINTNYTIQARYTYVKETQMPSAIVTRTTFTSPRVPYAAGINKTTVTRTDSDRAIRGGDVISISAKGDTFSEVTSNIIMGDTRLIPVGWYTSENVADVTYFQTPTMTANFNIKATNEGTLTLFVIYENQKWMGTQWQAVEDSNGNPVRITNNTNFTVKATRTTLTNISDFFVGILNVFTNTIPNLILRLFSFFA